MIAVDAAFGAVDALDESRVLTSLVGVRPPSPQELAVLPTANGNSFQLPAEIGDSDLVFLALHGGSGEDGHVQAFSTWQGFSA